jgi:hypothetical protein
MLYLILQYKRSFKPIYVFFQIIGFYSGQDKVDEGIKVIRAIVDKVDDYLVG